MNELLKPCPFCGMDWNDPSDLIDTLYLSSSWVYVWNNNRIMGREQVRAGYEHADFHIWNIICGEHNGGCGATMEGKSKEEVINKWNKRS